jgi:hypothetical protein
MNIKIQNPVTIFKLNYPQNHDDLFLFIPKTGIGHPQNHDENKLFEWFLIPKIVTFLIYQGYSPSSGLSVVAPKAGR